MSVNAPNRTQFGNRRSTEIPGNSRKTDHFWPSKCQKLGLFQDIDFKFCTHVYQPLCDLSIYFGCCVQLANFLFFVNNVTLIVFLILEMFTISKTCDSSLMKHLHFPSFSENQSVLSLKLVAWQRGSIFKTGCATVFPQSYFAQNMTSLWRHLRPTYLN